MGKIESGHICIYHNNCADGFGSAWVMRKWAKDNNVTMNFYGATHQNPPPDVAGKYVFIVDFSYKRSILEEMAKIAKNIVVIDHHKSAAADLKPPLSAKISTVFDMNHSGAMLTWFWAYGREIEPPQLLKHIEDRDLWKFRLSGTREIQACLFSYPYDFDVWDDLMKANLQDLRIAGLHIERKHFKDVYELVEATMQWGEIAGHSVPVANLPYTLASDAGHYMAKLFAPNKFAACYMDTPDGRVYSLRSTDDGIDVSSIAVLYGGGGHARAAGFRITNPSPEMNISI